MLKSILWTYSSSPIQSLIVLKRTPVSISESSPKRHYKYSSVSSLLIKLYNGSGIQIQRAKFHLSLYSSYCMDKLKVLTSKNKRWHMNLDGCYNFWMWALTVIITWLKYCINSELTCLDACSKQDTPQKPLLVKAKFFIWLTTEKISITILILNFLDSCSFHKACNYNDWMWSAWVDNIQIPAIATRWMPAVSASTAF